MAIVGVLVLVALAAATGSVLLLAYGVAAASVLAVVTLIVAKLAGHRDVAPVEPMADLWFDLEDREAA